MVVKPFGPLWNCCKGVSFHDVHDVNSIVEGILQLGSRIDQNDGILLDSFHKVFKPAPPTNIGGHAFNPHGQLDVHCVSGHRLVLDVTREHTHTYTYARPFTQTHTHTLTHTDTRTLVMRKVF